MPVDVLDSVIYDAVSVVGFQSLIRKQQIGIDVTTSFHMLPNLSLQNFFLPAGHNRNANLAAALKDAITATLSLVPVPVMRRSLRSGACSGPCLR